VTEGARHGDAVCVEMLVGAAERLGDVLATVVNFYNPSLIVLGGRIAEADERFLTSVRQVVYSRAMPLNTRNLLIAKTTVGEDVAAIGAVHMVLDELFSQPILARWLAFGSPAGQQGLTQASGA
jgi:predicted NBD/HSP70 family sugar kinase